MHLPQEHLEWGRESGFEKLFSSQNTEAEQTFRLSLAGHHSHQCIYSFFSDKRATFGIAQAAELIIEMPQGCFKQWAYPPRTVWSPHHHPGSEGKLRSPSSCGQADRFAALQRSPRCLEHLPRAGSCQRLSESGFDAVSAQEGCHLTWVQTSSLPLCDLIVAGHISTPKLASACLVILKFSRTL